MDAFEHLAADLFWNEGYWVRTGVKIALTREDKAEIDRPSSPRWEVDLVAYQPSSRELLVLECKSYLDSGGVHSAHFQPESRYAHRYKLFHDETLRGVIVDRLRQQFNEAGLLSDNDVVKFGLVYGHATARNEELLCRHFESREWLLFGPAWIRSRLAKIADGSYENSTAAVVSKLLSR